MRSIHLTGGLLHAMQEHARATYPEECAGYLLGREGDERPIRTIVAVEPGTNQVDEERRRRYALPPDELRQLERRLDGSGRAVVGFYHSHPDHPARPSEFDRERAWPWYTYVVLSVDRSGSSGLGAFELDPNSSRFHEVPIVPDDPSGAVEHPGA